MVTGEWDVYKKRNNNLFYSNILQKYNGHIIQLFTEIIKHRNLIMANRNSVSKSTLKAKIYGITLYIK